MKNLFYKMICLFLFLATIANSDEVISKEVYIKLQEANKMIEKKEFSNAKKILNEVLKTDNSMEKTYALQSLANIYINQQSFENVIKYYEQLISLNTLEKKILIILGFLYLKSIYLKVCIKKESSFHLSY